VGPDLRVVAVTEAPPRVRSETPEVTGGVRERTMAGTGAAMLGTRNPRQGTGGTAAMQGSRVRATREEEEEEREEAEEADAEEEVVEEAKEVVLTVSWRLALTPVLELVQRYLELA